MEEGNHDDTDEAAADDDAAGRRSSRVQFATDVGKSRAADASTPSKDVPLLQPNTTDDGYLTPTTRTTADSCDLSYLQVVDSPTDAAASCAVTDTGKGADDI